MALVKFNRYTPRISYPTLAATTLPTFEDVNRRMSGLIDRVLNNPFEIEPQVLGWMPAMEIIEKEHELLLTAELPGINEKDIDLSFENGMLTIRGEKAEEKKEENEEFESKVYLYERSYGSFERSFTLPPSVDATAIKAEFTNGVLTIHLPKTTPSKVTGRKIEIAKK